MVKDGEQEQKKMVLSEGKIFHSFLSWNFKKVLSMVFNPPSREKKSSLDDMQES